MSDYTMKDAISMAYDGNVSGFKDAVNGLLMDKIQDAVAIKRVEVASSFMAEPQTTEVTDDVD